jgi:hypothetical protein
VNTPQINKLVQVLTSRYPEYAQCFGVEGCDLSKPKWWAAYIRQSLEEQAQNNRIPEYLLTCARMAKEHDVVVPIEYIIVDHESSEYLDRKNMAYLRKELIAKRHIAGAIFTHQGRLSADPLHQLLFERECAYYGVKFLFGDAPAGTDWASTAGRQLMAQANWLRIKTIRESARAGNIGRVIKGWVPAGKTPYGYSYEADREIAPNGRILVKKAWWEVNELDPNGNPLWGSEAWVVIQIFTWIGLEGKSTYWVALELNRLEVKPRNSQIWSPAKISPIVKRHCYTGKHAYNTASYVPNPERPLGDITAEIKRTLRRPKPQEEHVPFNVPTLVDEWLWQKANSLLNERNKTKVKTIGGINALGRSRVFCPMCARRMTIRRDSQWRKYPNLVYYICTSSHEPWNPNRCGAHYIPLRWLDDLVWNNIANLLKHPALVINQQHKIANQDTELEKQLRLFEWQITEGNRRIARIQKDWEDGGTIYTPSEAQQRISEERQKIDRAKNEKTKLESSLKQLAHDKAYEGQLREALERIRDANLSQASFEDKRKIVELLDVKVYPCNDLSGALLSCAVSLEPVSHQSINIASPKL